MSVSSKPGWLAMIAAAMFMAAPAMAQEQRRQSAGDFVVAGVGALPEFEGSDSLRPVPFFASRITARGIQVDVDGLRTRINLLDTDDIWRAGLALSVTLPRNDSVIDAPAIEALGNIDLALEIGAFAGFEAPFGNLPEGRLSGHVQIRQDVLGAHDGLLVTPELKYFFAVNRMLRIGAGMNATWASDDYMQTYFGIDAPGASASGLVPFTAQEGFKDVGAEIYSIVSFSEQWGVFSRLAYNRLLGDAADSPVVRDKGDPNQVFLGAGIFFAF